MRRTPLTLLAATVLTGAGALAVPGLVPGAEAHGRSARTTLHLADGTPIGTVRFTDRHGTTKVTVELDVPDGATAVRAFHGFHVHANDNPANGAGCTADPAQAPSTWFVSADGHLRSGSETHGDHVGDMAPLQVNADGQAYAELTTQRLSLNDLDGRVVIVHAGPDNLGNVPSGGAADQYTPNSQAALDKTRNTGNAGDRVACGVIRTRG